MNCEGVLDENSPTVIHLNYCADCADVIGANSKRAFMQMTTSSKYAEDGGGCKEHEEHKKKRRGILLIPSR